MIFLQAVLGRFWWQIPAALGVFGVVLTWDSSRKAKWVNTGKQEVRVEIEKVNDNAAKLGKRAADKSASGGVRGQRDPTTRD